MGRSTMDDEQLLRYSRHILINEIGIEGQESILQAKILVFGAGGLGSPALLYLAAAGCGRITIVDSDNVDFTNLQRQIAHTTARVGESKVASAATGMWALNPNLDIEALPIHAQGEVLDLLVHGADVVLDCTDNFSTRQQINAACVKHHKPLVSGAAIAWDAQITVFDLRHEDSPCYACVYPPENVPAEVACSTMGVFAPLTGIVGATQAAEALKLVIGVGSSLQGRLLMLNALHMEWAPLQIKKNKHCPVCGNNHPE